MVHSHDLLTPCGLVLHSILHICPSLSFPLTLLILSAYHLVSANQQHVTLDYGMRICNLKA